MRFERLEAGDAGEQHGASGCPRSVLLQQFGHVTKRGREHHHYIVASCRDNGWEIRPCNRGRRPAGLAGRLREQALEATDVSGEDNDQPDSELLGEPALLLDLACILTVGEDAGALDESAVSE